MPAKRKGNTTTNKYPEAFSALTEMGFDSESILKALESTEGNLETATAILLGEATPEPINVPKQEEKFSKTSSRLQARINESHQKMMATYKVFKCKEPAGHDKRNCSFFHNQSDRRRNPFEYDYSCFDCPLGAECKLGDACPNAHTMLEKMFHPDLFKISMCTRTQSGSKCDRGVLCAFAHSEQDLRTPERRDFKPRPVPGAVEAKSEVNTTEESETPEESEQVQTESNSDKVKQRLLQLIKDAGSEGLLSFDLPKKYLEIYGEKLETSIKLRLKEIISSFSDISVQAYKNQQKFIYNGPVPTPVVKEAKSAAQPAPVDKVNLSKGVVVGISYSAILAKKSAPAPTPAPVSTPIEPEPVQVVEEPESPKETTPEPISEILEEEVQPEVLPEPEPEIVKEEVPIIETPVVETKPVVIESDSLLGKGLGNSEIPSFTPVFGFTSSLLGSSSLDKNSIPMVIPAAPGLTKPSQRFDNNNLLGGLNVPALAPVMSSAANNEEKARLEQQIAELKNELAKVKSENENQSAQLRNTEIKLVKAEEQAQQYQTLIQIREGELVAKTQQSGKFEEEIVGQMNERRSELNAVYNYCSRIEEVIQNMKCKDESFNEKIPFHEVNEIFQFRNGVKQYMAAIKQYLKGRFDNIPAKKEPEPVVQSRFVPTATASSYETNYFTTMNFGGYNQESPIKECALPSCHNEGTYICTGCQQVSYCSADHQR